MMKLEGTAPATEEAHSNTPLEDETSVGQRVHPGSVQPTEDDGSVPEKQINRWNNEGGSLTPAD